MAIINMQTMRYINLLDRESRVKTSKCFVYNNTIYFAVPPEKISKAIGPNANNIRRLQEQIGKKIRIIKKVGNKEDAGKFVQEIVAPVRFKSVDINDNVVIITAGSNQSKASLIGRDKRRLLELSKILKDLFDFDLKII